MEEKKLSKFRIALARVELIKEPVNWPLQGKNSVNMSPIVHIDTGKLFVIKQ